MSKWEHYLARRVEEFDSWKYFLSCFVAEETDVKANGDVQVSAEEEQEEEEQWEKVGPKNKSVITRSVWTLFLLFFAKNNCIWTL